LALWLLGVLSPTVFAQVNGCGPNGCSGGTPGGSSNQVQYNSAGAFGGLTNGASGTVLTSNGPSALPSFQAVTGTGTVTSVGLTAPSIFTVSGSPVTSAGVLALTANGISGGVPYFSSATQLSSSALLTANALMLGGGAGASPVSLGSLGTTTTVLHGNAAGVPTFGAVNLATDVTNTLPVGNGGTGLTSGIANSIPFFSSTTALSTSASLTWTNASSTLAIGVPNNTAKLIGANGTGSQTGTNFNLDGGNGGTSGAGGALVLNGGLGSTLPQNAGGQIIIPGGAASNTAVAQDMTLFGAVGTDAAHSGNVIVQDFNGDNTLVVDPFGNIFCACASAVGATDQFLYIGISAGAPTGTPAHTTGVYANSVPVRYDTTNNRFMVYNSGWKNVADQPTTTVGTFTSTFTGLTATVTCTSSYYKAGSIVTLALCAGNGTSNANTFTMTGLPGAITPTTLTQDVPLGRVLNAGSVANTATALITASSGTLTFEMSGISTGWNASSTKGFQVGQTISYLLN